MCHLRTLISAAFHTFPPRFMFDPEQLLFARGQTRVRRGSDEGQTGVRRGSDEGQTARRLDDG
jgi:hypothetical protein